MRGCWFVPLARLVKLKLAKAIVRDLGAVVGE